jgi:divalent metal cation (Fe/Co/Zn/Cd) transporter
VMVHVEPRAVAGEHLFDRIRAIAARRGLLVHELSAHQLDGQLYVEMHLEVPDQLSLRDAHRRASDLEDEIRTLDDVSTPAAGAVPIVNIQIEPLSAQISDVNPEHNEIASLGQAIEDYINNLPEYSELVDCHDVRVREVEHKIRASCHCAMDGNLPITKVHEVIATLEDRAKKRFPQVARITIHPEPVEER